jgi:hypothetical protein
MGRVIRPLIAGWGRYDRGNVVIVRRIMNGITLASTMNSMWHELVSRNYCYVIERQ